VARIGKTHALIVLASTIAAAGCAPKSTEPVTIAPAPAALKTVYVDISAYWKLHPAADRLAALERDLAQAQSNHPRILPAAVSPEPPPPTTLPVPEKPIQPVVSGEVDVARADKAIDEDALLRKLAEPDIGGQAYERRMVELRRKYLKLERKPSDPDPAPLLEEADRASAEIAALERQRRDLARKLSQPLLSTREELIKARQDLAALVPKLADLRRKNLERLEAALEVKPAPTQRIPVQERREAFELRERTRAEQEARQRGEAAALKQKVRETTVPPAQGTQEPPPPSDEAEELARARIAAGIPQSWRSKMAALTPPGRLSTARLLDLVRQREELRKAIQEDLQAVAVAAAKERGERVVFAKGTAPDGTAALRGRVRQYLIDGM
jgi:hypothetical protein